RHGARTLDDGCRVVGHFFGGEAILLGVLQIVKDLRRPQQRLGGNTPPVEANTSKIVAVDDSNFESALRLADCRDIAASSRAYAQNIERVSGHGTNTKLRAGCS